MSSDYLEQHCWHYYHPHHQGCWLYHKLFLENVSDPSIAVNITTSVSQQTALLQFNVMQFHFIALAAFFPILYWHHGAYEGESKKDLLTHLWRASLARSFMTADSVLVPQYPICCPHKLQGRQEATRGKVPLTLTKVTSKWVPIANFNSQAVSKHD